MALTTDQQNRLAEILRQRSAREPDSGNFLINLILSVDLSTRLEELLEEEKIALTTTKAALPDIRKAEDDQLAADAVLLDDILTDIKG